MSNWLLMVFVALILWGITGVTQKLSTNHISAEYSFVWFAVAEVDPIDWTTRRHF